MQQTIQPKTVETVKLIAPAATLWHVPIRVGPYVAVWVDGAHIKVHCKPFAHIPRGCHDVQVYADGTIYVWDRKRGNYYSDHCLPARSVAYIMRQYRQAATYYPKWVDGSYYARFVAGYAGVI